MTLMTTNAELVSVKREVEMTAGEENDRRRGTAAQANETFGVIAPEFQARLSGNAETDTPIILRPANLHDEGGVATVQSEKAGGRLAEVLNATLR
jgi:hypothetical protein